MTTVSNSAVRPSALTCPAFLVGALLAPSVIAAWGFVYPAATEPGDALPAAAGGGLYCAECALFTLGVSIGLSVLALAFYHRTWVRRLSHLFMLCILLELFYRFAYGGPVTPGLLLSVPETSGRETVELIAGHALLSWCLSLVMLIAIAALLASWRAGIRISPRRCLQGGLVAASLVLASLCIGAIQYGAIRPLKSAVLAQSRGIFPVDIAVAFAAAASDWLDTRLQASLRENFRFANARIVDAAQRSGEREVYVVVIGETSRRSNWSLFGYSRDTTPRLDAIKDDLIRFDRVTSNASNTILSLPLALTRATAATRAVARSQKSLIALLNEAGFETFWISNQERSLVKSNSITAIALDADHVSFTADMNVDAREGGFDSNLLSRLDGALTSLPKLGRAVIFLHMEGSHFGYKDRYPTGFDHFRDGQNAPRVLPVRQGRLVDQYDNSVLFTDSNVRSVIDRLADCACRSGLIYFSDHGERLFDNGLTDSDFGHGFPSVSRQEIEVPLFLWLSPGYREANPAAVARLKKNAGSVAELHNVFETVVDLAGVDYGGRDPSLSLFSEEFKAPDRLQVLNMQEGLLTLPVD